MEEDIEAEATNTEQTAETNETVEAAQEALEIGQGLFAEFIDFLESLFRPWSAYQIGIAIGVFVLAYILSKIIGPRYHDWIRSREGWPKWRYRLALVVHQRLNWIIFVTLIWAVVLMMREITWPSRSYLLSIIATLSLAWLVVMLATRLIRSPILQKVVRYGAWIYVTLSVIGITSETSEILDKAALEFGTMRISLLLLIQAAVILGVLFVVAQFLSRTTSRAVRSNEDISPSMQVLVLKFVQVLLYGAAFFLGMKAIGIDLTGLAVLSGAIGVGLGFGLQKVVSNLVSGVIILLDKSIKPGDVISLGDTFGWIQTLGARYASVVTRDGREYLIPNEDLITNQVVNWSHSDDYVRLDIHFGTAYGNDPHLVRKLAIEAAKSVDRVLSIKSPVCHIVGFGDSSVDYILRFWISDPTGGLTNIRGNVYLALWDMFQENDISIPFPQREVRMLGDDT